jgi:hypothetical protein
MVQQFVQERKAAREVLRGKLEDAGLAGLLRQRHVIVPLPPRLVVRELTTEELMRS